jgi:hypothetical protein
MNSQPTLKDLQEGRVTPEQFLASRNNYRTAPVRVRTKTVRAK